MTRSAPDRTRLAWLGLVDQGVSSLSNFLVTLIAFLTLDGSDFGAFAIGWAWFAVIIGISRSIVSEPQAIRYAVVDTTEANRAVGRVTGSAMALGIIGGIGLIVAGVLVDGVLGDVLTVLGIAMPVLALQDSYRLGFIIAGQYTRALVTDGVWLLGVVPLAATAVLVSDVGPALMLALWGAACALAAAVAAVLARIAPRLGSLASWLREEKAVAYRFAADFVVQRGSYELALILILAVADLATVGAVAGARFLFAPLTVLYLSAQVVGLPELVRIRARSEVTFERASFALVAGLGAAGAVTGAVIWLARVPLSELVGDPWAAIESVLLPITILVVSGGVILGANVVLRALAAARQSLRAAVVGGVMLLLAAPVFASLGSATDAAWGLAVGTTCGALVWLIVTADTARRLRGERSEQSRSPSREVAGPNAMRAKPVVAALVGALVAGSMPVVVGWRGSLAVVLFGVTGVALLALHRAHSFTLYSPVWLTAAGLSGIGVVGFLFAPYLEDAGGVSAYFDVSPDMRLVTLAVFVASTIAVVLAALGTFALVRSSRWATADIERPPDVRARPLALAAVLQLGPLMVIASTDWAGVLERTERIVLPTSQLSLIVLILGLVGTLAAVGMLAWLLADPRAPAPVLLSLLAFDMLVLFGTGSRIVALAPVVAVIAYAVARGPARTPVVLAVIAAVTALGATFVILEVRDLPEHGISPYAEALVAGEWDSVSEGVVSVVNNVVVSFPLTAYVLENGIEVDQETTLVSLNPMFGRASGAYDVLPRLRVNAATPYSAIGEIWRVSRLVGWAYFLVVGGVVAVAATQVSRARRFGPVGAAAALALVGITVLFVASALQYNLRGTTRYLYVLALASVGVAVLTERWRTRDDRSTGRERLPVTSRIRT